LTRKTGTLGDSVAYPSGPLGHPSPLACVSFTHRT
jgi:hypothetical protein